MPKTDAYEFEILSAFEKGRLQSVATKADLAKLKAAARATAIKDRRVNIRLSSGDLSDIGSSPPRRVGTGREIIFVAQLGESAGATLWRRAPQG